MRIFQVNVVDKDNRPLTALVGNGSDGTVKLEWYTYRKGEGAAVRLKSIRINHLIPYEPTRDFTDIDKENVKGLSDQPEPIF